MVRYVGFSLIIFLPGPGREKSHQGEVWVLQQRDTVTGPVTKQLEENKMAD